MEIEQSSLKQSPLLTKLPSLLFAYKTKPELLSTVHMALHNLAPNYAPPSFLIMTGSAHSLEDASQSEQAAGPQRHLAYSCFVAFTHVGLLTWSAFPAFPNAFLCLQPQLS